MDTTSSSFPSADKLRIGFIGAGRLGKALAWSLARAGLRVSAVASVTLANARALAGPIPGCVKAGPFWQWIHAPLWQWSPG